MIWLNGKLLVNSFFPNNEIKLNEEQIRRIVLTPLISGVSYLSFKYLTDSDLIDLMFIKKYLDTLNQEVFLTIQYYPYSRMDRSKNDSAFTLKYVANFINSLNFSRIDIIEPHSNMCVGLTDNGYGILMGERIFEKAFMYKERSFDKEKDIICFPDDGAQKRYCDAFKGFKQVVGFKSRDFISGKISKLDLIGLSEDCSDCKAVIINDLCSYGGTFMMSGNKLKEVGVKDITLIITHCEESILLGDIFKPNSPISRVFTTNSIINDNQKLPDNLIVYDLMNLIREV